VSNKAWILNTSRKHVNYEEDKNNLPMNKPYNIQNTNICNGIFHISFFKALLINEGESRRNDLRGKWDSRRNDSLPLYLANKNMLKLNYNIHHRGLPLSNRHIFDSTQVPVHTWQFTDMTYFFNRTRPLYNIRYSMVLLERGLN
jgi:hypothetical protein